MQKVKFPIKFSTEYLMTICQKPLTLFVCAQHSTVVTSFPFNKPWSPLRLIHSSSTISCMKGINDKLIVGGNDCFLYIWQWKNNSIVLSSTMQLHSSSICSITTSSVLDICCSIDTNHIVFVVSLTDKRVLSSFKVKCNDETVFHKICICDNARLIISSESENLNTQVAIYDLYGNILSNSNFTCEVVGLHSGFLRSNEYLMIVTLGAKRLEFFCKKADGTDWLKSSDSKKLWEDFDPKFLCIREKERVIWYVTRSGSLNRVII